MDGDEVIFHPWNSDELFVLPHEDETIHVAGRGLWLDLEWLLTSGVLIDPIDERSIEPFDGQVSRDARDPDETAEVRASVVATEAMHDRDGSVVCLVFRMGDDHYTEPWEEGAPLPVGHSAVARNARQAAEALLGEPARVEETELESGSWLSHYRVTCTSVADKGFGFHDRLIDLDLKGKVIVPTEHSFKNCSEFERSLNARS